MLKFNEYLKYKDNSVDEVATTTASVAGFARPFGAVVKRNKKKLDTITIPDDEEENNGKKGKKQFS